MRLACALLAIGAALARATSFEDLRVVYEWYKLDFTWKDDSAKLDAYVKHDYDARNNFIQNVKVWNDSAFLTLPRSRRGVPATLARVASAPAGPGASPRLRPFPDWESQKVGDCGALQNVQAIEIDPDGLLWAADSGVVEELSDFSEPVTACPPKLAIFDVRKEERVAEFVFDGPEFRPRGGGARFVRLTDIVVDARAGAAFVSAVGGGDAAIFVYRRATGSATRAGGLPPPAATSVVVNGTEVPLALDKVSLALSPARRLLYFAPSWDETLRAVGVDALLAGGDVSSAVRPVARLPGLCYALVADAGGRLYFSVLETDSVGWWDTAKEFGVGSKIVARDASFLQFPSSFSFDRSMNLWVVSNRFQTYLSGTVNLEEPNFRLMRAFVGSESYMFAPSASDSASFPISNWLVALALPLVAFR